MPCDKGSLYKGTATVISNMGLIRTHYLRKGERILKKDTFVDVFMYGAQRSHKHSAIACLTLTFRQRHLQISHAICDVEFYARTLKFECRYLKKILTSWEVKT